jgi:release factor glutamine methyltransferase
VLATRINTALRGLRVNVRRGDALDRVRGRSRAWDVGTDGRAVLDRLCVKVPALLAPGGTLLTVHSALCGVDTTLELLREGGLKTSVVARDRLLSRG